MALTGESTNELEQVVARLFGALETQSWEAVVSLISEQSLVQIWDSALDDLRALELNDDPEDLKAFSLRFANVRSASDLQSLSPAALMIRWLVRHADNAPPAFRTRRRVLSIALLTETRGCVLYGFRFEPEHEAAHPEQVGHLLFSKTDGGWVMDLGMQVPDFYMPAPTGDLLMYLGDHEKDE